MAAQIVTAFMLGWHIAELYHFERLPGETEPSKHDSLPGIGRLPQKDRAQLLTMQITVALGQLGQKDLDLAPVRQQVQVDEINVAALQESIRAIHVVLLITFTAQDARFGKAYGLGRALAETMLVPTTQDPESFAYPFNVNRISTLQAELMDLKSSLPLYAAEAAVHTLDSWTNWVVVEKVSTPNLQWAAEQKRHVGQSLRRQGEIWYGLLAGEINPLQMLQPKDYVTAAGSVLTYIGELGWSFLHTNWLGRLLGIVAIGASALLLAVSVSGHFAAVAGTAVLLLGALGITAGSVVTSVRQVLRQAQAPLWEAELSNEVATAALRLPNLSTPKSVAPAEGKRT